MDKNEFCAHSIDWVHKIAEKGGKAFITKALLVILLKFFCIALWKPALAKNIDCHYRKLSIHLLRYTLVWPGCGFT